MSFYRFPMLLRLSLGLTAFLLLIKTQAHAFEPTDTGPLDNRTAIDTTGERYQYFQPPADGRRLRGATTTTGTRGGSCSNTVTDSALAFSGLGPRATVGLTTSVHPEFVWYVTELEATSPLMFRLLVLDDAGQPRVVDSANFLAEPGFMHYQLPDTVPPLDVGKDYLWQVIIRCPGSSSSFLASTLPLQVVTPTPALTAALTAATTDVQRAKAYGEAGIWYNALALVSADTDPEAKDVRAGLLQDLAVLESDDESFSATLTAIAEQAALEHQPVLSPMSSVAPPSLLSEQN